MNRRETEKKKKKRKKKKSHNARGQNASCPPKRSDKEHSRYGALKVAAAEKGPANQRLGQVGGSPQNLPCHLDCHTAA